MIAAGAPAPDFEAVTSTGEKLRLSSLKGKPVVLYFYPKSFTTGCTIETKKFADLSPELAKHGVVVVGVSVDDAATQKAFAADCHAGFPIVADSDKKIAESYGVLGTFKMAKRVTFFIDASGKVDEVVESMRPGPHTERATERFLTGAPTKG